MKRSITIAERITLVVALVTLLLCVCIGAFLVHRERQAQWDEMLDRAAAMTDPIALRGYQISNREFPALGETLNRFLTLPGVESAAVLDPAGRLLLSRQRGEQARYAAVELATLRRGVDEFEPGVIEGSRGPDGERMNELTLPVFGVRTAPRGAAGAPPGGRLVPGGGSQYLVGYYHLRFGTEAMRASLLPFARAVPAAGTLVVLLLALVTMVVARRATVPLTSLSQLVEDVSAGRLDRQLRSDSTGEVKRITSMINILLSELQSHKLQVETDNKLLTMKVEERTVQLSRRNEELNQAVEQLTQSKHRLHQLAFYDNLTSLPNRSLFIEELELLLRMATREQRSIALLFIDLDNFKRINDSLGHTAGDLLLKEVAARLSSCLRSSDVLGKYVDESVKIDVSRLGGDEFTVVLNHIREPQDAGVVADRLLAALQTPMLIEGHELVVTPSIGIAIAPRDADTVEELLKLADTAMYTAKSAGRNSYRYFSNEMRNNSVGRLRLEAELRKAIERRELLLHYQPQVSASTGEIMGLEALARWNHPEQGLVPPAHFIPLAEETGLIVELGAWTLIEACRNIAALRDTGLRPPKVSVNVSSLQFNPAFTTLVQKALAEHSLDPALLELELTEGVIMSNARASIEALHDLKQIGVSLSVDDFGTGYSSLSYLSQFPLDEIKIDRSFVVAFDSGPRYEHLVKAIIAMGKSLNLRLVAEGVDSLAQFGFLRAAGVDLIQGYLFSRPVTLSDIAVLLRNNPFPEQIRMMQDGQ